MKTTEEKIKETERKIKATLRKLYRLVNEWYDENDILPIKSGDESISEYGSATVGNMEGEKVCRLTVRTGLDGYEYKYKDIQGFAR